MSGRLKLLVSAVVFAGVLGASAPPRARVLCPGFLPENDWRIPVGDVRARGISEEIFNSVLDRAEAVYAPIVAAKGAKLVVNRRWDDPTVNAYANQSGDTWYITMFGGLARHSAVTAEGFALVACHELGHHLGGFPKMRGWATNEGGSDYFATLKCLRKLYPGDKAPADPDAIAAASCKASFPAGPDRTRCLVNSMAGHSISMLLHALRPGPTPPSFATPDPSVVDRTSDAHPAAQCRHDTYFQGALCPKPVSEEVSDSKPGPGACTLGAGFKTGVRPLCWYKPPAEELEAALLASRLRLPDSKALKARLEALQVALSGHDL